MIYSFPRKASARNERVHEPWKSTGHEWTYRRRFELNFLWNQCEKLENLKKYIYSKRALLANVRPEPIKKPTAISKPACKKKINTCKKNLVICYLLRSHQASQQTNFGRVRDQPGFPAPKARFVWKILDVCTSPHAALCATEREEDRWGEVYHRICLDFK